LEAELAKAAGAQDRRDGHGWWPYLGPYIAFMLLGEVGARLPETLSPLMLFVKPAAPGGLMIWFWRKGAYPELRGFCFRSRLVVLDVLLGLALAAGWMAPFLFFPGLLVFDFMRPDTSQGFDPTQLGAALVPLTLTVRMLGYGVVTPFFEELFVRSFVMRYSEVYASGGDFRDVPMAHFAWTSFITTLVLFTITHVPWEYGVMLAWAVCTNLWFYYRGHIFAVIIAHGVTNASILLFVALDDGRFLDHEGKPMALWFFV